MQGHVKFSGFNKQKMSCILPRYLQNRHFRTVFLPVDILF